MGRNGAGKSTLLRHAAGLMTPTRGRVQRAGRVALLLQNPGDYLVHDTVDAEAPAAARERAGLTGLEHRHPRELSGGERQRLALAVVLGDGPAPAVLALDEPTRGMDRLDRLALAGLLRRTEAAVIVATHDPEFAALFADRVVLLADGAPIADGPVAEILGGGTYFATETGRIVPGALRPEDVRAGAAARGARVSWQLASFAVLAIGLAAGAAWYERGRPDARVVALVATLAALAALGRIAFAALPNVKPTTDIVLIAGYSLGGGPGFAVGAIAGLTSNFFFGQGPWTPWQMAAWGATGIAGATLARVTAGRIGRWPLAIVCALAGLLFAAAQDVGDWVNFSGHSVRQLGRLCRPGHRLRPRPRSRLPGVRARVRARAARTGVALHRPAPRQLAGGRDPGRTAPRAHPAAAPLAAQTRRRLPRPPAICSRPRTATAASAARRGGPRIPCMPGGRRSVSASAGVNPADVHRARNRAARVSRARAAARCGVRRADAARRRCRGERRAALRRPGPGGGAPAHGPARRLGGRPGQPHGIRRARAPSGRRARSGADVRLAGSPAGRGRRLQLRHRRWGERRRRHRRGARGARPRAARPARDPLHRRPAEPRRGSPGPAGQRLERPVDRVRGPGPDRRGGRSGAGPRAAVARRSTICARWSPPTAMSATRGAAIRHRYGSPARR